MFDFFMRLFDTSDFPARWRCGNWSAGHGWLHILSDLGVWSAYIAIPYVLGYFLVRKKDVPFRFIFVLFGAFILTCGTTHLMEAVIFWWPAYRLAGAIKLVTAFASWATVFALIQVTPQIMSLRSTAELEAEIARRQEAEASLLESRANLERQVQHRTRALQESEELYRIFVEGVKGYGVYLLDPEGRVVSWNSGAEEVKGYRTEEIIGSHFSRFYSKEDNAKGWPEHNLKAAREAGKFEEEGWRIRKDGSHFWASVALTALRSEVGDLRGFSKIIRDLTERKRSEERFRTVVESVPNGVLMVGLDGSINLVNPELVKMFGYTDDELVGRSVEILIPEQMRDRHPAYLRQYFADPQTRLMGGGRELFGRRKDGSEFPVEIGLNPIQIAEEQFVLASIIDLTERRRTEGEYRRLASLLDQAYDPSLAWTSGGRLVFWNRSAEELYGYSKSEAVGKTSHQLLQTIFPNGMTHSDVEVRLIQDGFWEGELLHTAKDGRKIAVESRLRVIHEIDHSLVLEANRDITKRKQADDALRDSEARFRQLANTIPQLAWMARPDGHIYWYNQQWYDYTGTSAEAMAGWGWQSVHDPAVLPDVLERWQASIATGETFDMVLPLRGADGRFRSFLTRIAPLRSPEGCILQWFGTNTDISEQAQMQEELRQSQVECEDRVRERTAAAEARAVALAKSEAALRLSEMESRMWAEAVPQIVWMTRPDGWNTYFNQQWMDYTGLTREESLGHGWIKPFHPDDQQRARVAWQKATTTISTYSLECRLRRADGIYRWWLIRGVPLKDGADNILKWFGTCTDIDDLKRAEVELKASLREKEVLLKEIHHRVKNNLQIVSALLDLQASHAEDKQVMEMFKESQGRVRSMALIHERLYRSRDLAHVDFGEYVLQLADDLYHAYKVSNDEIVLEVEVDVPQMSIDIAIPCGLLINELMSNALKHAFDGATEGRLRVSLRRSGDINVLTVADTGVGFPAGVDFRNTASFGMQLVNTLVEQLNGEIDLKTAQGTEFTVNFPDMG